MSSCMDDADMECQPGPRSAHWSIEETVTRRFACRNLTLLQMRWKWLLLSVTLCVCAVVVWQSIFLNTAGLPRLNGYETDSSRVWEYKQRQAQVRALAMLALEDTANDPPNTRMQHAERVAAWAHREMQGQYAFAGECRDCCTAARKLFQSMKNKDGVFGRAPHCFVFNATNRTYQMVQLQPEEEIIEMYQPQIYYTQMASMFIGELMSSGLIKHHGEAIWMMDDNCDIPEYVSKALKQAGTPLLAHAIQTRLRAHVVLLPDFHFITSRAFVFDIREIRRHAPRFKKKRPGVFWRGTTTGVKCSPTFVNLTDPTQLQMCLNACDGLLRVAVAKLATQWTPHEEANIRIQRTIGVCGDRGLEKDPAFSGGYIPAPEWAQYRGILDIDGNVGAWGLRWRLETGSVVLAVESDYTSVYRERMKPYTHYIPVAKNLSNFADGIRLLASNHLSVVRMLEGIVQQSVALANDFGYFEALKNTARQLNEIWQAVELDCTEVGCPISPNSTQNKLLFDSIMTIIKSISNRYII